MAKDRRGRTLPKGIRQRSGDYEGRFMYEGRTYTVHASTITETTRLMEETRRAVRRGEYIEKSPLTFGEYYGQWLNFHDMKAGTKAAYQSIAHKWIMPKIGKTRIVNLTAADFQKVYAAIIADGKSKVTVNSCYAIINGVMKSAVDDGIIRENPARRPKLPTKNSEAGKRIREAEHHEALTKEQQALFEQYAADSILKNYFAVMLRTGMRGGELLGLKWSDIDRANKVLHIRRTLKEKPGGFFEDTPKSKTSVRDIPITPDVMKALEGQRNFWGFKVTKIGPKNERYLFCDDHGGPLHIDATGREMRRITNAIRAAGHEFPDITPHSLRHTFATRAIESGMNPQVLKTILGHSSLAMTMDLYSHVMPDTKAAEMEKIAVAF